MSEPEETFSIRVLVEPIDHPAALGAVHMGLVMYAGDKPMMAFQGVAVDRETGQYQAVAIDPVANTLRAFAFAGRVFGGKDSHVQNGLTGSEDNMEITIYEGAANDVIEKMLHGMEAAVYMNSQNLPYVVADLVQSSQNSNSVLRTFVEAMGIEYSEELESLFAPGDGRILIPVDWEPKIQIPDNFDELSAEEQSEFMRTLTAEVLSVSQQLNKDRVIQGVMDDPVPTRTDADSLYYDREPIYAPQGNNDPGPNLDFDR